MDDEFRCQLVERLCRRQQFHGIHLLLHDHRRALQRMDLDPVAALQTADLKCGAGNMKGTVGQLHNEFHFLLSSYII